MKKLLIITDLFPDKYIPNGEVFVQHQADELAKHYNVRVIATRLRRKLSIEEDVKNNYKVTYVYIPYIRYVNFTLIFTYRIYAIPIINKVIREWQPDIIHVHDFKHVPELFQLNHYLKKYRIPRYLSVHNLRTHSSMIRSPLFNWFYRMTFRHAYSGWDHIFTVNDRIREIITRDSEATRITNIGNAVGPAPEVPEEQLNQYRRLLADKSFRIISVGSLRREKGFWVLIRAIDILLKKNYDIQVCIVGKGKEKASLLSEIEALGLTQNFILTGDLDNALVRNLLPLFDAFVLPSYSETFGVVYIEAMYAGLPTIGVRGQGIDGVIKHGVTGFLVNPQDVNDLAEKIEYIIKNRELAGEIAGRGQRLIKDEYMLHQLIRKITQEYEQ
jgi:glycosyltransferase involved in cell wall biosynthesis